MSSRPPPSAALRATGVMAVLRGGEGVRADRVAAVLDTLVAAGVRCLEVTLNTPDALASLRAARERLPAGVELGAGTVLTPEQVDAAADSGAAFVVAPDARPEVAARAHARDLAYYPGALTPTELAAAWDLGATAVKVFPAAVFGPGYLRALAGPFPDVPVLPTGGIGLAEACDYLAAGALAVGVGGPLIGDALDGGDLGALAARARGLVRTDAG